MYLQTAEKSAVDWFCWSRLSCLMCLWVWLGELGWLSFALLNLSSFNSLNWACFHGSVGDLREKEQKCLRDLQAYAQYWHKVTLITFYWPKLNLKVSLGSREIDSIIGWKKLQNHIAIGQIEERGEREWVLPSINQNLLSTCVKTQIQWD